MKRRAIVFWALFGCFAIGAAVVGLSPGRPELHPIGSRARAETDAWLGALQSKARNGDWLVIRGTHVGDQVVAAATLSPLSHAAVLDKDRSEAIEAVGAGVRAVPLLELIAQAHRVQVIRPRGATEIDGRAAVERARSHIGKSYDWLGVAGLPSHSRYYCTELVVDAYRGRDRGWPLDRVIEPMEMQYLGDVLFDSGPRPDSLDQVVAAELEARFAKRLPRARGMSYAAQVAPGLYRGGVPDEHGVEWLKSIGIKTVVNLRHFHGEEEGERVRAAGMRYEWIQLESTDPPTEEQVARFVAIATDPNAHPVYVHCLHGVDRTGAMVAVYRMRTQGWSNADALAEMEHFGAHELLRDLRHFVAGYRANR